MGLKVSKPSSKVYLVSVRDPRGFRTPELEYHEPEERVIKYIRANNQIKGILINSMVWSTIAITVNLLTESKLNNQTMMALILGIVLFMVSLNYFGIYITKMKVRSQLMKDQVTLFDQ